VTQNHYEIVNKHVGFIGSLDSSLKRLSGINLALSVDFFAFFWILLHARQACGHFLVQELCESLPFFVFMLNIHEKVY